MELWQKKHICTNLVALQEMTACNVTLTAHLQADGLLSAADVDILNTVALSQGKLVQATLLYEILKTKTRGYEMMTKALFLTKQCGALKILLDGFREQDIINPLERCGIHIKFGDVISSDIQFLGRECKLRDIWKEIDAENVKEVLMDAPYQYDLIDVFITQAKKFVLAETTVPAVPPFYIPRSISNRLKLNPRIFKESSPDVFVFKCIDRISLTRLAHPNATSMSSIQILELTARFILLEDEIDWEELQTLTKAKSCPVHLIKRENDAVSTTYILEGTAGNSDVLWKFIDGQPNENRVYIPEDDMVERLEDHKSSSGLCICDTPGMGKSWLLANLARKILERHPDRLVIFLPLAPFISKVKGNLQHSEITNITAMNLVLNQVSPTSLSKAILMKAIDQGSLKVEVFFDGLDEVKTNVLEWTKTFLKEVIGNRPNVRIYVTSRPQLRRELEKTLGVIAYDILPFTEDNQKYFLVHSWQQAKPKSVATKLEGFASACLQNAKQTLSEKDHDIFGIPLQCYLLAKVYLREACLYSDPRRESKTPHFIPTTVHQMYKTYITNLFGTPTTEEDESTSHKMKCYHIWKALQILFPDLAEMYSHHYQISEINPTAAHLSYGILQVHVVGEIVTSQFVHLTLAEFLVAEYFAEVLVQSEENNDRDELTEVILQCISSKVLVKGEDPIKLRYKLDGGYFYTFRFSNPVLTYFINEQLANSSQDFVDHFTARSRRMFQSVSASGAYDMLRCSISQSGVNIFRYLRHGIGKLDEGVIKSYSDYLLVKDSLLWGCGEERVTLVCLLFCAASHFSNLAMILECQQLFSDSFHCDLEPLCQEMTNDVITPMHWALKRADYELVEYFLQNITLENRLLLFWCIQDSYGESIEMCKKRIEICKLLLSENKCLLNEAGMSGASKCSGPLVADAVHPELLRYLIQEGADLNATKQFGAAKMTIAFCAGEYMSTGDYEEFCHFLIHDCHRPDLFNATNSTWRSPQHLQNMGESFLLIMMNLMKPIGIDLDSVTEQLSGTSNNTAAVMNQLVQHGITTDAPNLSAIGTASSFQQPIAIENTGDNSDPMPSLLSSVGFLQALVELTPDMMTKRDVQGNVFLHRLPQCLDSVEYHQFAEYLIRKGLGDVFRMSNNSGETPLHAAVHFLELLLKTLDLLVGSSSLHGSIGQPLVDVNAVDIHGNSILHWALRAKKSLHFVKHLISLGADWRIKSNHGSSLLHVAASYGLIDHVKYFVGLGSDVNDLDDDEDNVLNCVIVDSTENVEEIADFLLTAGVDKLHVNKKGQTSYMIALKKGITSRAILQALSTKHKLNDLNDG